MHRPLLTTGAVAVASVTLLAVGVLRRDLPLRWFGHVTYGLLVAAREAVRIGDIARRDVGQLVLSSLLAGVAQGDAALLLGGDLTVLVLEVCNATDRQQ